MQFCIFVHIGFVWNIWKKYKHFASGKDRFTAGLSHFFTSIITKAKTKEKIMQIVGKIFEWRSPMRCVIIRLKNYYYFYFWRLIYTWKEIPMNIFKTKIIWSLFTGHKHHHHHQHRIGDDRVTQLIKVRKFYTHTFPL